jgi:glycosyltransferase involved in cell wall biosynthesis
MMAKSAKRILMLTHEFLPFRGGIATYCAELAAAATALGHHVTVIAPDYGKDNSKDDKAQPFKVRRFAGGLYKTSLMPRVIAEVATIELDEFDIIHAAEWSFVVALHLIQPFKKIPFIATVHGTDIFGFATSKVTRLLRATDTLKHADYVVANSIFTAQLAKSQHPYISDKNLIVTLLGVNPWWIEKPNAPESVLKKYKIDPHRKILLTVSRIDERKGHRRLLQALALLSKEEKDQLTYVIVGECLNKTYLAELHELAEKTGIPVIFAGGASTDDIRKLYQLGWLYCMLAEHHPKKVEGFGLVYLEAAAQALPSLASPMGGVPEVVIHDKTGYMVDEYTPDAVAKALKYLIDNPQLVKTYGENAQEWATTFTWKNCAEKTYNR